MYREMKLTSERESKCIEIWVLENLIIIYDNLMSVDVGAYVQYEFVRVC